jgi:hypothetical protein
MVNGSAMHEKMRSFFTETLLQPIVRSGYQIGKPNGCTYR